MHFSLEERSNEDSGCDAIAHALLTTSINCITTPHTTQLASQGEYEHSKFNRCRRNGHCVAGLRRAFFGAFFGAFSAVFFANWRSDIALSGPGRKQGNCDRSLRTIRRARIPGAPSMS